MDTVQEHVNKAAHNRDFLATIPVGSFADWAIVVLFYRALHVTSAVIHERGDDHGKTHPFRQRAVEKHFSSSNADAYAQLYSRSRLVRYDQLSATQAEYNRLLTDSFVPLLQEARAVVPELQ